MKISRFKNPTWVHLRNICCAALITAFSGSLAYSLEPSDALVLTHGPLSLRPQLAVSEQFDDNIFYSDIRKSDFITTISPGLKFLIGQDLPDQNHVKLQYTLDQSFYVQNTSQDAMQHRFRNDVLYKQNRIGVDGYDMYEMLSSVLGGAFNVGKQKIDRNVWWDVYRVDYKIGERMGVYAEVQHVETDFKTHLSLFDTRTISGMGGFQYGYSDDTFFFGEIYYGETSLHANALGSPKPSGTTFVGGFVGARGNFTEKIKGTLKAGYEVSTFSGGDTSADKGAGSAPVVEASISYALTERLTTSLAYSRRQNVSVQFTRSSYALDTVSGKIQQILGSTGRLRLDLSATYAMYSFDSAPAYPTGRSDTIWTAQTGANYFFQTWLYTRLEYSFERFASDFSRIVDYHINRVTLSAGVGY